METPHPYILHPLIHQVQHHPQAHEVQQHHPHAHEVQQQQQQQHHHHPHAHEVQQHHPLAHEVKHSLVHEVKHSLVHEVKHSLVHEVKHSLAHEEIKHPLAHEEMNTAEEQAQDQDPHPLEVVETTTKLKNYECDVCMKDFHTKQRLTLHYRTHTGERPFSCEVCQKRFARTEHLKVHMRRHTGERPFQCKLCNKKFSRKSLLIHHIRVRHAGEEHPYPIEPHRKQFGPKRKKKPIGAPGPYCDVCRKSFSHPGKLVKHLNVHPIERLLFPQII